MFCYPVAPFQGDKNGKRRAFICFFVTQCKWKETLTSAFGRFDTYTALLKREQVENDVRRRILQSIPDGAAYYGWCGIASKTIDFLLQFILQQPLLSQLTITVRGHWSWWSHLFVGNILHCWGVLLRSIPCVLVWHHKKNIFFLKDMSKLKLET